MYTHQGFGDNSTRQAGAWRSPGLGRPPRGGLPGPAPRQAPQSAHREDDGEERGHAERDDRPDEEEASTGPGDLAADTLPRHVEDGDGQRKERREKDDEVPRSPFGEHQRSVQPYDKDGHSSEV